MNTSLIARREAISRALDAIKDPLSGKGLLAAGRVSNLLLSQDGSVLFAIEAPAGEGPRYAPVRDAAEAAAREVEGITKVTAVLTAHDDKPAAASHRHAPGPTRDRHMRQPRRRRRAFPT